MGKKYVYSKFITIFPLGAVSLVSLMGFLAIFPTCKPKPADLWALIIAAESIFFLFFALPIAAIYYILNIELLVNDQGISYKTLFKKFTVPWNEITNVTRTKYLSGGAITNFLPKDLKIETSSNKTLKVINFLKLCGDDSVEGIVDFEGEITRHGIEIQMDARYMARYMEQKRNREL